MPYLKGVSKDFNRVRLNESILSGMPVIKNTRISINLLIACIRDGMTLEEIKDNYNITNADIIDALEFIIAVLTIYMDEFE